MMKETIIARLEETPFIPHPAIKNAHAQTISAYFIPRRAKLLSRNDEPRIFDLSAGVRLLARCSWQQDRASSPTLLIVHGLEGSADSAYMLGTAEKALSAGMNVIRLNLRNCGGTHHLTPAIYHAGLTDDIRQIVDELTARDRLREIYLVGFSLGGNIMLKLAGEYSGAAPDSIRGVIAVSPSLDLPSCADAIEMRSNLLYHLSFLWSLKSSMRRKARLFPDRYDASRLDGVWSIRQFDDAYTAPLAGFRNVADYYSRASALPLIRHISLPTLIIHSKDDPFIPFAPFENGEIAANSNIKLLAPDHGGHVGFVSARQEGDDRFWAEQKVVDCVRLLSSWH
jgi:predicted alpha/beta-fold hydrolase